MKSKSLFLVLIFSLTVFWAQAQESVISGSVENPEGSPTEAAKVILTNLDDAQSDAVTTYTDENGYFRFELTTTGLPEIKTNGFEYYIQNRRLLIERAEKARYAVLYNALGQKMKHIALQRGAGAADISDLKFGIYIIHAGEQSSPFAYMPGVFQKGQNAKTIRSKTGRSKAVKEYQLKVSKSDFLPDSTVISLSEGESQNVDFTLSYTPKNYPLSIISTDEFDNPAELGIVLKNQGETDTFANLQTEGGLLDTVFIRNRPAGEAWYISLSAKSPDNPELIPAAPADYVLNQETADPIALTSAYYRYGPFAITINPKDENANPEDSTSTTAIMTGNPQDENNNRTDTIAENPTYTYTNTITLEDILEGQEVKLITEDETGKKLPDTTNITLNKGNLEISLEPEMKWGRATYASKFMDSGQFGTTFNVIYESEEVNHKDTAYNIGNFAWTTRELPVKAKGETKYKITAIPQVSEGNNLLHTSQKEIYLKNDSTTVTRDTLAPVTNLTVRGWVQGLNTTGENIPIDTFDMIVSDFEGNTIDSTRFENGTYEYKTTVSLGGEDKNHTYTIKPKGQHEGKYFTINKYPASTNGLTQEESWKYETTGGLDYGREIIYPDKIRDWADTLLTINYTTIPQQHPDPYTGEIIEVNPDQLRRLEGSGVNVTNNVFISSGLNRAEYDQQIQRLEELFGYQTNYIEHDTIFDTNSTNICENRISGNMENYGWNIRYGSNSTTAITATCDGNLSIRLGGEIGIDPSEDIGSAKELVVRQQGITTSNSSWTYQGEEYESLFQTSITPIYVPENFHINDRVLGNIVIHYKREQAKTNPEEKTYNNIAYFIK